MTMIEVYYVAWQVFYMSAALAAGILTGEALRGMMR